MSYVTGSIIKELRERKGYTQRQLAESVCVSDKTVSKWETGKGLPDVGIITELASALGVSLAELLNGEYAENRNRSGNMKKISFYVCPLCGNVIQAMGNGSYSCCGILLPAMEPEEECAGHEIQVRDMDGEYYVCMEHEMDKTHYLSFLVYATSSHVQFVKLYPEQSAEARFTKRGHGFIYACCNRHGLYRKNV
ncbi:helix-turn-helix domain-containing protein [[Clostridium] hylemonae]|uniref:helix-turn-helix domain-containing protein n=1 Tax=[Clostridium] hylemonae TaxID=89153 RepID=UPI001FAA1502|nr:helix-turn-helix domain-containing protein [[Clostridium] hylemonae]